MAYMGENPYESPLADAESVQPTWHLRIALYSFIPLVVVLLVAWEVFWGGSWVLWFPLGILATYLQSLLGRKLDRVATENAARATTKGEATMPE